MAGDEIDHQLLQVIAGLASESKTLRDSSEDVFETLQREQPGKLFGSLVKILCTPNNPAATRLMAAVLLRRLFSMRAEDRDSNGRHIYLNSIAPDQAFELRQVLLQTVMQELDLNVGNKIADAVAQIALAYHGDGNEWAELRATLLSMPATTVPASSIKLLLRIAVSAPEILQHETASNLCKWLRSVSAMSNAEGSFAIALLLYKVLFGFVRQCDQDKAHPDILFFLSSIPRALIDFAATEQWPALAELQGLCSEFVSEFPKYSCQIYADLTSACVSLSLRIDCDTSVRSSSIELLVSLIESRPATFRRRPDLVFSSITCLLSLICEHGDEYCLTEWLSACPSDEEDQETVSVYAEQSLDRVACVLGECVLCEPVFNLISSSLQSPTTTSLQKHGLLKAIASVAEGCSEMGEAKLDALLALIWPCFDDGHPQVQYAACHAIGQLCTDFCPRMQCQFGRTILLNLAKALAESPHARVQAHAAAALVNFAEGAEDSMVQPGLVEPIMARLLQLLGTPTVYLQEQAIATMAALSAFAKPFFALHLDGILSILIDCLAADLADDCRLLQCRALEAITIIAVSVGADAFCSSRFAEQTLQIAAKIQQTALKTDDPMRDYIYAAWIRLCCVFPRTAIAPFSRLFVPALLSSAACKPDVAIFDEGEGIPDEYSDSEWDFTTVDGRQVGIKTAVLEERQTALSNLSSICECLKEEFLPFLESSLSVAIPLLTYKAHDGVRIAAIDFLPIALESVVLSQYSAGIFV